MRQLRQARKAPRWSRPFGLLLLGIAITGALFPDLPLPPGEAAASSTAGDAYLLPHAVQPKGSASARRPLVFSWHWDGPPLVWRLVLLDSELEEILRVEGLRGLDCTAAGALDAALTPGGFFHWFVEGDLRGHRVRTPLVPLVLDR